MPAAVTGSCVRNRPVPRCGSGQVVPHAVGRPSMSEFPGGRGCSPTPRPPGFQPAEQCVEQASAAHGVPRVLSVAVCARNTLAAAPGRRFGVSGLPLVCSRWPVRSRSPPVGSHGSPVRPFVPVELGWR